MDMMLLPHKEVFVAYTWNWDEGGESDETNDGDEDSEATVDEEDSDGNTSTTHTVTFKCMGANCHSSHQTALEHVAAAQEVPVRLFPEPDNPEDSNAIAFQCCIAGDWRRIGYVVKEAVTEVHESLESGTIIAVKFAWTKFLLCWSKSGPGYYAGINISKQGNWSKDIVHCRSTK